MCAAVSKFEEKCLKLFEQYVVIIETCSCHGNDVIRMCTSFISMCATLASLRSEEVFFKENCLRLFVVVVVMETM